jgi:hypothetical protein
MLTIFSALAKPGDRVLTEALTYPGMKALASLLHLSLEGVAMDAEGMRVDALEEALGRTGAKLLYCMPTIHNPTGSVLVAPPGDRKPRAPTTSRSSRTTCTLSWRTPPPLAHFAERTYHIAGVKAIAGPAGRSSRCRGPPSIDRAPSGR